MTTFVVAERAPEEDRPIGVFDSGVGGLSVLRYLRRLVANDLIYVADSAWCPYGPRPPEQVRERAFAIVDALVAREVDLIVVACNTASTVALAALRERYAARRFVGMEPAVKPAAAWTRTGAIGVLATATTAHGEALWRLVDRYGRGVSVHVAVPAGLVEVIERGEGDSQAAEEILRPIVARWCAADVDAIVLGCTHYPFARAALERLAEPGVEIFDPAPAVARQAARLLGYPADAGATAPVPSRPGSTTFLTSGDPATLRTMVQRLVPAEWTSAGSYGALVPR